ncbi:MAG TPA: YibE/F family protein [Acidimicrobiales bacterium]|nr:YibE/F family protein [Acidimicrobiales bacterium]
MQRQDSGAMALGEHHHHHGGWPDDWDRPGSDRVHRLLGGLAVGALLVALGGMAAWWPRGEAAVDSDELGFADRVSATVTDADDRSCSYDPASTCRVAELDVDDGDATTVLETGTDVATPAARLEVGDEVVLNDAGEDVPPESRYSFADLPRGRPLALLAIVFAVAVVALGRLRGLLALAGIGVTFAVLLWFLFPALLRGAPPLGVALTAATVIAFGTLYLAHGLNQGTTVALLGTLASLLLTAVLAVVFAGGAELSGLASEDSLSLLTAAPDLDFRGLLLAAVIIGALGVLDDVTVTQVAAVAELHRSDPSTTRRELFRAGTRIGRDHIASTVNTLVLAYSAAALPLLLIYSQSGLGFGDVLSSETVAVEVVQTLVGSIGLVASVPITTALAALVISRRPEADDRLPLDTAADPWPYEHPGRVRQGVGSLWPSEPPGPAPWPPARADLGPPPAQDRWPPSTPPGSWP